MTGHDDREGIAPKRLPDRARRARGVEPDGDVAVRTGRAWWNGARNLVNAAMKRRYAFHVEHHSRQVARLSGKKRDYPINRTLNFGWGWGFASVWKSLKDTSQGVAFSPLRELNADYAALGPSNGAGADGRIEQREETSSHMGARW